MEPDIHEISEILESPVTLDFFARYNFEDYEKYFAKMNIDNDKKQRKSVPKRGIGQTKSKLRGMTRRRNITLFNHSKK